MPEVGLTGKCALITGGGTGIGAATARAFIASGAKVLLTGRREKPLQELATELGDQCVYTTCDISKEQDVERLGAAVEQHLGGLDILVNNAGIYERSLLESATVEDFRRTVEINLVGTYAVTRRMLEFLRKADAGANIVMVSSTLGARPLPGAFAYGASKAGMNMLAQNLALELAPEGIRVNVVSPGIVETPIHEKYLGSEKFKDFQSMFAKMQPLGRVGQPEEVAAAVLFLAGPNSGWTTGAILDIDGGVSLV